MVDTWTRHRPRPRVDPAFLFACLLAVLVIGGFSLLAGLIAVQDARDCDRDGRCHPCGVVTDDGVTDHLADYWARCGKSLP